MLTMLKSRTLSACLDALSYLLRLSVMVLLMLLLAMEVLRFSWRSKMVREKNSRQIR